MNLQNVHNLSLLDYLCSATNDISYASKQQMHGKHIYPKVNIKEFNKEFVIAAELPGVSSEDISIDINNHLLTIKAKRNLAKQEKEDSLINSYQQEIIDGNFYTQFNLPVTANTGKVTAKVKDGVLFLNIPKSTTAIQKTIPVTTE